MSGGMKWDLNHLTRSWTWVAWMETRNLSHQIRGIGGAGIEARSYFSLDICPQVKIEFLTEAKTVNAGCCSVALLCLTICNPTDCSTPGFPVLHYLPEFAQTRVHWVSDAIQPSRPLSSPSLALNLSQHQGLFQWVGSSHQEAHSIGASASVLPMNIQDWSPLGLTCLICLLAKGLSRGFSSTTLQEHQFFVTQLSLWSNCSICTWLLEKP